MGQAKIKRDRRKVEEAKRKLDAPTQPVTTVVPSESQKPEPAKAAPAPKFIEHVRINCNDVIRRRLEKNPRFLKLYWNMQRDFGDRNYGREVCLHEAGHSVLMEQDGMTNVRFMGPDIVYDPAKSDFIGSSARAVADDQPNAMVNDEFIFKITSHMAAGGVTLRKLGGIKGDAGDDGDFEYFNRKFAHTPVKSKETAEQFWKRAQDAVAARLDEPETKQKVLDKAQEYFHLLYPSG